MPSGRGLSFGPSQCEMSPQDYGNRMPFSRESRMKRMLLMIISMVVCTFTLEAHASPRAWVEGRNYVLLNPVQRTHAAADKMEVLEVFSYACPFCNKFQPVMEELKRNLPVNAQISYLPASFSAAEDMPMF